MAAARIVQRVVDEIILIMQSAARLNHIVALMVPMGVSYPGGAMAATCKLPP